MEKPSADAIAIAASNIVSGMAVKKVGNPYTAPELVDQFHFFFTRLSNDFQKKADQ